MLLSDFEVGENISGGGWGGGAKHPSFCQIEQPWIGNGNTTSHYHITDKGVPGPCDVGMVEIWSKQTPMALYR